MAAYAEAQESIKEPEKAKRAATGHPEGVDAPAGRREGDGWGPNGQPRQLEEYSVNYRRLNELLDPEVRAEVVTESESEYVRVS